MELYPAIDLRGGVAVRLTQGDFAREVDYGDPLALVASFVAAGAPWLHVVDLSAARTGVPHERATLARIVELADGKVKVQAGGGIRSDEAAEELLETGVARVVLGTAALEDPGLAARRASIPRLRSKCSSLRTCSFTAQVSSARPSVAVEPGVPVVLAARQPDPPRPTASSSGRRVWLARWLTSPENP